MSLINLVSQDSLCTAMYLLCFHGTITRVPLLRSLLPNIKITTGFHFLWQIFLTMLAIVTSGTEWKEYVIGSLSHNFHCGFFYLLWTWAMKFWSESKLFFLFDKWKQNRPFGVSLLNWSTNLLRHSFSKNIHKNEGS